jgi:hypothetical protein
MSDRNAQQLLMTGGKAPKGIEYPRVGIEVGGRVVSEPAKYHVREYDKNNPGGGKLKYWDDGNPIEGINIDVETIERDPQNRTDDGTRRFYVEKVRERQAIADAIRAAGSELLELDGYLFVTWTGEEAGQGAQPAKTFTARYIPAGQVPLMNPADLRPRVSASSANGQYLLPQSVAPQYVQPVAQAPAAQAYATQAQQYAPAVAKRGVPADVYAAMANAGLDLSKFEIVP